VKIHLFERAQLVPYPLRMTFDFFNVPRNLERLMPAFLHFEFLSEPPPVALEGTVLEYRFQLYAVPIKWRTKIVLVEPPLRFVDIQEKGPYAFFRHTHDFRAVGDQTEMMDRVEYAIPFGPLGEIARLLFVDRSLREIFDYRQRELGAAMRSAVSGTLLKSGREV